MDAGQLDRVVKLLRGKRPAERKFDGLGEPLPDLVPFAEVWANVRPVTGAELLSLSAGGVVAKQTLIFTVRWRPDLNPLDGLEFDGKVYEVESVLETSRREFLELRAWARAESDPVPGSG